MLPIHQKLFPLLCIIVILILVLDAPYSSSHAHAIDLSRAFNKKNNEADEKDDAIANARKLVSDLTTGSVTKLLPKKKEAKTCDEIMAKSLVVANEEKAKISADKDEVVKAAALLSTKIDELTSQLKASEEEMAAQIKSSRKEIAALIQQLDDQSTKHATLQKAQEMKTKADIDKVQNSTANKLVEKDNEMATKIAEVEAKYSTKIAEDEAIAQELLDKNEKEIAAVEANALRQVREANTKTDSMLVKTAHQLESEQKRLKEASQREISVVKDDASMKIGELQAELSHNKDEYEHDIQVLEAKHEIKMKEINERAEVQLNRLREDLEMMMKKADAKISAEKIKNKELEVQLQSKVNEVKGVQETLKSDLELARGTSFKLEKEVSYWRDTFDQQGYCNTTLIKLDSQQFATNMLNSISQGLDLGHQALIDGLSKQIEIIQKTGGDVLVFIKEDLLPKVEQIADETRDKALVLYTQHLAEAVNANLLPVYNDKVLPVYNEHVSPVVKTIEAEVAVALQKSQDGVQMARTKAGTLVKETASEIKEIDVIDEKLPQWLSRLLDEASVDGLMVVDKLCKVLFVVIAILCRSLIFRLIGILFSIIWKFCPLRLFVGKKTISVDSSAKEVKKTSKVNGAKSKKVKVY